MVKEMLRLTSERTHEGRHKTFLTEGPHLVEAALNSPRVKFKKIFITPAFLEAFLEKFTEKNISALKTKDIEIILASEPVIKKLSTTITPQGIVGVAEMTPPSLEEICNQGDSVNDIFQDIFQDIFIVVADAVQDPGNLGTLIRTADAAGADALVTLLGSCDPYSPKALRAAAGSLFNLPVVQADTNKFIRWSAEKNIRIIGTDINAEKTIYNTSLCGPLCLAFGNEGQGLSSTVRQALAEEFVIPMPGHAESLNVTAAAAICIFEAVRQRQRRIKS